MDALEVLEQLESTSGSNAKKQILQEHSHNPRLAELLDAALNFKRKFHIKKFNDAPEKLTPYIADPHQSFLNLLDKLQAREITGNEAINNVEQFLSLCNDVEQKWYARVLRKDLKIGVNISTVNKCGFDIPVFDVQLAKDGSKCKKVEELVRKGSFASFKLDGYRCVADVRDGSVTLHSRNGTVYENFPQIEEAILKAFGEHNIILDGEIMSNDFNSMQQSAFASKRGTTVGDVCYHIFDCIPVLEWDNDKFISKAAERYELLNKLFKVAIIENNLDDNKLALVPHFPIKSVDEIYEKEKQFIELGYEGLMLNPNIPYYRGKPSNKMLKFKTMLSMEATVDSCYEGRPGTKYVGTLGGLTVTQENGVTCDVGSGFSNAERDWIWQNQEKIKGRVFEAAYQELTPDNRMRFPIFKRWRPDKE